jgi:hypothetical protein
MKFLTLLNAYRLLTKYRYVIYEEDSYRINLDLNDEGLIIKMKKGRSEDVLMFPYDLNENVKVNMGIITFSDRMKWQHDFQPLAKIEEL